MQRVDDAVVEDLGMDPPVLHLPVKHLMMCPHPPLHCPLLRWILASFFEHLILSWCPQYQSSALTCLCRSRKCKRTLLKILILVYLPAGEGPWIHTSAKLISDCRLPAYLWDVKGFPFLQFPFAEYKIQSH